MLVVRSNEFSVIFENVSFSMNPDTGVLAAHGTGLPEKGAVLACYNNPVMDHNARFESNKEKLNFIMNKIVKAAIEAQGDIKEFKIPDYIPTKK